MAVACMPTMAYTINASILGSLLFDIQKQMRMYILMGYEV